MCVLTALSLLQHNGKKTNKQTNKQKKTKNKIQTQKAIVKPEHKDVSTLQKHWGEVQQVRDWNAITGNRRAQTWCNTQWRQLTRVFRLKEGVAQDNQHQPDFKAAWHLTGRGHYCLPNVSWNKANKKKNKKHPKRTFAVLSQRKTNRIEDTGDSVSSEEMLLRNTTTQIVFRILTLA